MAAATTLCIGTSLAANAAVTHIVTGSTGTGGMLNATSQTIVTGEKAVFLVKANTGYLINTVTGCGGKLSGTTYTTGVITGACTVTATFKTKYSLTLAIAGTGSGTVKGAGSFAAGTTIQLTATAASGSTFTGWSPAPCAPLFSMPAKALTCMATFTKMLQPSYVPETVYITGGCFQMGSPESEIDHSVLGDETLHEVCVEAFEMGKYEVTFDEYEAFADATGRRKPSDLSWDGNNMGRGQHPVVHVDWNDAVAYAEWQSKKTGRTYRLPTEAEWEYAARAGTTTSRYWADSDDLSQACAYANAIDKTVAAQFYTMFSLFNCTDGYFYTAPVGSFKPNPWNLYDMMGNVSEWTCSPYDSYGNGTESTCATVGASGDLSIRGGSWYEVPGGVRSAYRNWSTATYQGYSVGFRLARVLK